MSGAVTSGSEIDFSGSGNATNWYRYDVKDNSDQKVVMHTFMYNNREMRNYTILYDRTKKAALWAAFAMNNDVYPKLVSRADSWHYDPALVFGTSSNPDYSWQPKLNSSYSGGYTRGHQVASNDRKTTLYQMYQTDYYSNMTPQTSDFNTGSTSDWDELEGDIQDLGYSITGRDTLYVVTGAIFGSGYTSDAKDVNNVTCPVPTQYYKCVMRVKFNASGQATSAAGAAYLFDHKGSNAGTQQNKTIKYLEQLTGFDFFANIPSDVGDTAESTFTNLF